MYALGIVLTVEKQERKESDERFRCKGSENSHLSLFYNVRQKFVQRNMHIPTRKHKLFEGTKTKGDMNYLKNTTMIFQHHWLLHKTEGRERQKEGSSNAEILEPEAAAT